MSIEKISPINPVVEIDFKNKNQFQDQQKSKGHEKPAESFTDKYKAEINKLNKK